ncbi:DUF2786 domain-containing protein [Termitidicoccus mucosus]|uniref:Uncharacterized protein n=1 Tax=Termitidicoccus mucosus TaxID=1184151 RepID=A0A178IPX6_9BACT|nr:hypothetical protein AW736_01680 [Opitutaceae bacterium TSB47]
MNTEIQEKLKKLLRLKERGGTQAETEQALAAAQRLALRHNIDLNTIDTAEEINPAGEPFVEEAHEPVGSTGKPCQTRLPACHKFLSLILQKYFAVEVIDTTRRDDDGRVCRKTMSLIGRKTNVQIAIYAYGFLYREFMDRWHRHRVATQAPMSSRNSFFYGVFLGLSSRLQENRDSFIRQETLQESSGAKPEMSTALILQSETDKVRQAVRNAHPRIKYTAMQPGNTEDKNRLVEGIAEGKKIKIHRALSKP